MLKDIKEFIEKFQWKTEDELLWKRRHQEQPRQYIIVNGQRVENSTVEVEQTLEYIGKGGMWDVGEEKIPLYGFKFNGDGDIWVDSIEDFKFWYQNYFKE